MRQKDENPLFRGTKRIVFYVHIPILCSMSVMLDLRWAPFTFLLKAGVKHRCLVIEPTCIHMLLLDRHLLLTEYLSPKTMNDYKGEDR